LLRKQVVQESRNKEGNMVQHRHAWNVEGFQSADTHFATVMEECSVANCGTQPQ
jgi:hypothetical protein